MNYAFLTVTDSHFFPGTLATANSILEFHPEVDILVIENEKSALSNTQRQLLGSHPNIKVISSAVLETGGRYINAWELKAYAAHDYCGGYDVICVIDSDCLLCSSIESELRRCHDTGSFIGGQDGSGTNYGEDYSAYGIEPSTNPKYMSTSLCMIAVNDLNRRTLKKWADYSNIAEYNGRGHYPGHGDQGILNAILYSEDRSERVELLNNELWSQHWRYWDAVIDYQGEEFVNLSADGSRQRAFHCGGGYKYWCREHRDKVLDGHSSQTYPYAWFLTMLWFGKCQNWSLDPLQYLPDNSHHLRTSLYAYPKACRENAGETE